MTNKIILFDIDDVVADLIKPWLSWYNWQYVDNLKKKSITDWDISQFTVPSCGEKIYDFVHDPRVYNLVKPIKGAKKVINNLRKNGHRVIYITAANRHNGGVKLKWLNSHGFNVKHEDYIESKDKSTTYGDLFFDDGWHNISNSIAEEAYLYTQPWNEKYEYNKRVRNWTDIEKVCKITGLL
jgi:5'(3')-deoxyribonucleotidase